MSGPDAVAHLQSMVSNDVEGIPAGGGAYALLLTPKARVISDLEVFNTGAELVLACPPETRDDVVDVLLRARFRKKVELEPAVGAVVWGDADDAVATFETPIGPYRLVEQAPRGERLGRLGGRADRGGHPPVRARVRRPTRCRPRPASSSGRVSFTKGCYPGQEPIARLHYRGHANRGLRGLAFPGDAAEPGAAIAADDREVGRVTSVADSPRFGAIGLAVLRREVADRQKVDAGGHRAVVRPLPFA